MDSDRIDVTFDSAGDACGAWLYSPRDRRRGEPAPALVMAHGLGGVKEQRLDPFARRFADAGFVVLCFDYRRMGASTGSPRGSMGPEAQQEDYRNAVSWIRRQPGVDPDRIGLWGTSLSGGHVLQVAAFDRRVKCVVSNVPAVDVWRNFRRLHSPETLAGFQALLQHDREQRYDGRPSRMIPISAPAGEVSVLGGDSYAQLMDWAQTAPSWVNRMSLDTAEQILRFSAAGVVDLIAPTPLLLIVAKQDELTPPDLIREAFERAGEPKRLLELEGGHYASYDDPDTHGRAAGAAARWFAEHLGRG